MKDFRLCLSNSFYASFRAFYNFWVEECCLPGPGNKIHVSKDERRTSQSSNDTIQKKKAVDKVKKQEEPQPMRRENQRPKRDTEGSEEPQQSSAPAQTQVAAKEIPESPSTVSKNERREPPKGNILETMAKERETKHRLESPRQAGEEDGSFCRERHEGQGWTRSEKTVQ